MEAKKKICKKGTSKTEYYLGCGKLEYLQWGLCKDCKRNMLLNTKTGQELIIKSHLHAKKQNANYRKAELKEQLKTLSDYKAELQKEINTIVRLIDFSHPCIATGNFGKMNAGHFHSIGSNETLRFNLHNIHRQSEHSNSWKSGDLIRYADGIIKEYGIEYHDYIRFELMQIKSQHWTKETLQTAKKTAINIIKTLKSENKIYNVKQRISMRYDTNKELNLYV